MCDPEIPAEPDYDISVGAPYRYEMVTPDRYEGWLVLTVDDSQAPSNTRYSPETLDAAVRAFCQVLHAESPVKVTKRASASATRPGVFFPST